jgi:hypothetical protein
VAPAAMPAGAPTVAAAAKEPPVPAAGPLMVLTLAVMKGGLVIEWGCAAVPAGVPTAAMAPTARSQEAAAA